jgi:Asp-tRNA(Asn)/Glu-tRNA(Gln) amidotransferase A subunit family amidase
VKDLVDVKGVPRGNGNPHDMVAPPAASDAPVITSLRDAGADVYATTTLLEYAAGALHPDVAEAMNPYDSSRTAGGSSGGSAALVGASACDVAIGTDTGGSIRIPAHYCNVVGFKPTFGVLDLTGVQALAPSLDHVGLLARDVATTQKVFAAMTGLALAPTPSTRLRVGIVTKWLNDPISTPEIRKALASALERVREGADVIEVNADVLDEIRETIGDIILYEAWQVHGEQVERDPSHFGPETLRLFLSASEVTRDAYDEALATRARLLPSTDALYEGIDVLLTPSTPYVAPTTTPPIDTPDGEAEGYFTGPFNLTGDPALVLPCGFNDEGLPIGLQLSSPRGTDMALLRSARVIEELLDVPRREPVVK